MAHPRLLSFVMTLPSGERQLVQAYLFDAAGDEIPLHVHADFWHSSLCVAGACEVYDSSGTRARVAAGAFVEFARGREHAVRALEPGTIAIHVCEPDH
jgi:quercetin dioxygenase-like cupin family protein